MMGEYPTAVQGAVIGSMEAHQDLAMQFLASEGWLKGLLMCCLKCLRKVGEFIKVALGDFDISQKS